MSKARPWYSIKADAGDGTAEIWIYERIGSDFFGDGIAAKDFVRDLSAITADKIALHVNSPGGAVFDGQAIYTALRNHPAEITTYIDGLAASIASVIALAGDRVVMAGNALYMIHDPAGWADGTATELRKYADLLDTVGETLIGVYADRTGKPREEIAAAMTAETWYSAADALEFGFVDEVAAPLAVAASWSIEDFGFKHAPKTIEPAAAGGVSLSARNESDLRAAVDLIQGVLDQVGEAAAVAEEPEPSAEGGEPVAAEAASETVRVFVPALGYFNFTRRTE